MFTFYSSFYEMQTREPTLGVQKAKQLCLNAGQSSQCRLAAGCHSVLPILHLLSLFFSPFLLQIWLELAAFIGIFGWAIFSLNLSFSIPAIGCFGLHNYPPNTSGKERLLGFPKLPHSPLGWHEQVSPRLLNALVFFLFFLWLSFFFFFLFPFCPPWFFFFSGTFLILKIWKDSK